MVNVIHMPDQSDINDSLWDAHVAKYNFGLSYLTIKKENINKFISEVKKLYNLEEYKFTFPDVNVFIFENNKIFIQIDEKKEDVTIFLFTKIRKDLEIIFNVYTKYRVQNNSYKINFEEVSLQNGHLRSKIKIIDLEKLSYLSKDFYPFLDTDKLIEQFLKGKENLLIIGGKPGTGKSKFVSLILKWIIENKYKNKFLVSSAKDIELISKDIFWQKIENCDMLIFDDLDFMLGSRNENREDIQKNNFLSKLLSFTDGIINNNTKIIITTNQSLNELDEAILREGRIFDILNFRPLKKDEALKILKKENIKNIELDNEVFQSEVGSIIENYKKTGNMQRSYLKENVSLLHKINSNSIGFI